jgi:hypothetical protein
MLCVVSVVTMIIVGANLGVQNAYLLISLPPISTEVGGS